MVKSIIIIGSTDVKTSEYYKQVDIASSVLVTAQDHKQLTGHTSVGDIPDLDELECVLKQADLVYWAESTVDEFEDADSYYNFLNWLKDYDLRYHNVVNLNTVEFDMYKWNIKVDLTPEHIVFFGGSITAGQYMDDRNQWYATQVAQHFNKEQLNLATVGGSFGSIFHRFTQLDFYEGQIVVVDIPPLYRIFYCHPTRQLKNLLFADPDNHDLNKKLINIYHKDFLFYELLTKIRAMVAIARSKKLKLVFWLDNYKDESQYSQQDQSYFYNMPEFVPASWIQNYLVDYAKDKVHPGVQSNKFIADTLVKYIKTVYNKD